MQPRPTVPITCHTTSTFPQYLPLYLHIIFHTHSRTIHLQHQSAQNYKRLNSHRYSRPNNVPLSPTYPSTKKASHTIQFLCAMSSSASASHHYKFNVKMTCGGCSGAVDRVLKRIPGSFTCLLPSCDPSNPFSLPFLSSPPLAFRLTMSQKKKKKKERKDR